MNESVKKFAVEKTNELVAAPSCCRQLRDAATAWLKAIDTDNERCETERYLAELAEDIGSVDGLIAFAGSPAAVAHFGKEAAESLLEHGKQLKASGAKYCDCAACAASAAILSKREELLS